MRNFNVDYPKLAKWLWPRFLQKTAVVAWVMLLAEPMAYVGSLFVAFVDSKRLELTYNFQTMYVELMLNNTYPSAGGGIYIEHTHISKPRRYLYDDEQVPLTYLYDAANGQPAFYIYDRADFASDYDFIVKVPVSTVYTEPQMRAFINKYRCAGKRYLIQTY